MQIDVNNLTFVLNNTLWRLLDGAILVGYHNG